MALTGCGKRVENKMYVDCCDKKLIQPPAAERENRHLESVGKSSEVLLSSDAEVTAATLQESVPGGNLLNQPENQQDFLSISPDKVSDRDGKLASGAAAEKHVALAALFNNVVDYEAGKIRKKCNILKTDGQLEDSGEFSRENRPYPSHNNDLIDSIKVNPIGRQVASDPGNGISNQSDQNHYSDQPGNLSQVFIQN